MNLKVYKILRWEKGEFSLFPNSVWEYNSLRKRTFVTSKKGRIEKSVDLKTHPRPLALEKRGESSNPLDSSMFPLFCKEEFSRSNAPALECNCETLLRRKVERMINFSRGAYLRCVPTRERGNKR